jgi:hypothetical protein
MEPTGCGDSRQHVKESSPALLAPDVAITGNHLDVPRPGDNPNLLSPEILCQRRGMTATEYLFMDVSEKHCLVSVTCTQIIWFCRSSIYPCTIA